MEILASIKTFFNRGDARKPLGTRGFYFYKLKNSLITEAVLNDAPSMTTSQFEENFPLRKMAIM